MDKFAEIRLNKIDANHEKLETRLDKIGDQLGILRSDVALVNGRLQERDRDIHWAFKYVVFPLVTALLGLAYRDIDRRLDKVESFVQENGGYLLGTRLRADASNPSQNAAKVKQALEKAQASRVRIPEEDLVDAGQQFFRNVGADSSAWATALTFLNYRSSILNYESPAKIPPGATAVPPNGKIGSYQFVLRLKPPQGVQGDKWAEGTATHWSARVATQGVADANGSARLESLAEPQPRGSGVAQITIIGKEDTIVLDGEFMKNVTIRDADIEYDGGQVKLENVRFENCRFHFAPAPPSQNLGVAILQAVSVTFPSTTG